MLRMLEFAIAAMGSGFRAVTHEVKATTTLLSLARFCAVAAIDAQADPFSSFSYIYTDSIVIYKKLKHCILFVVYYLCRIGTCSIYLSRLLIFFCNSSRLVVASIRYISSAHVA